MRFSFDTSSILDVWLCTVTPYWFSIQLRRVISVVAPLFIIVIVALKVPVSFSAGTVMWLGSIFVMKMSKSGLVGGTGKEGPPGGVSVLGVDGMKSDAKNDWRLLVMWKTVLVIMLKVTLMPCERSAK